MIACVLIEVMICPQRKISNFTPISYVNADFILTWQFYSMFQV